MERWLRWRWCEILRLNDGDALALDLDGTSEGGGERLPDKKLWRWSKGVSGCATEKAALVRDRLPVLVVVWLVLLRRWDEAEADADADADVDDEDENSPADDDDPAPA